MCRYNRGAQRHGVCFRSRNEQHVAWARVHLNNCMLSVELSVLWPSLQHAGHEARPQFGVEIRGCLRNQSSLASGAWSSTSASRMNVMGVGANPCKDSRHLGSLQKTDTMRHCLGFLYMRILSSLELGNRIRDVVLHHDDGLRSTKSLTVYWKPHER